MANIAVIIPINEIESTKTMFVTAIGSVPSNVDIFVAVNEKSKEGVEDILSRMKRKNIYPVLSDKDGQDDFCTMVNTCSFGLDEEKYDYFSILECDDTYSKNIFDHVNEYIKFYPSIPVFASINEVKGENIVGPMFFNEAVWSAGFSEELGFFSLERVKEIFNFNMTGAFFKLEDWKAIGGLNGEIPYLFWYEYLLRAISNGLGIYVIPKIGYYHTIGREGSLSDMCEKNASEEDMVRYRDMALNLYTQKKC